MKTTTTAARRLLREGNPVPGDAFPDAARDAEGQAVLAGILGSPAIGVADTPPAHRRAAALPGWPAIRTWKVAVPAGVLTAALAGLLAVMLTATGESPPVVSTPPADSGFTTLIANLTAHPSAHPRDAAAVLRRLAATAARQPAVPLGPVQYSELKIWDFDLDTPLQYNLNYVSHTTRTTRSWKAADGSYLWYFTVPGGKYEQGSIPLQRGGPTPAGRASFAWYDPAKLPTDIAALRSHLINAPGAPRVPASGGEVCTITAQYPPPSSPAGSTPVPVQPSCSQAPPRPAPDQATYAIVFVAEEIMRTEPLPPATRASLLRVLAGSAAQGSANSLFIYMGTVKDRAGHAGVAIGYQTPDDSAAPGTKTHLEILVFDPTTGAMLGDVDAYCTNPAGTYPAANSCTPEGYDQILQVKAVQKIPAPPTLPPVPRWTPTTPSVTTPPRS